MKTIKIGRTLMAIGLIIFLIENFYFGWNEFPMSDLEYYADTISAIFIYVGFIIFLIPLFTLYELAVEILESYKNKKKES
jgi:hypothetical protein